MPKCVAKTLSKTDAGESKTHRAAIRLSEQEALRLFPKSLGKEGPHEFDCKDHTGRRWQFKYTNKASGPRIRPIEGYLESYGIGPGDTITICAPAKGGHPYTISFAAGNVPFGRRLPAGLGRQPAHLEGAGGGLGKRGDEMAERGKVRISTDMTLKRFREELEPLMPSPDARPFTCTGSPLECRLFIVGLNSATQLKQDFFGRYWCDDSGFLRDVFEDDYSHKRKKKGTRPRNEVFMKAASPELCLETNIYAVPTKKASQLKREDKNTDIIEYLIKTIRPAGIFVHTKEPIEFFQKISGCNNIAGDEPKLVKIFGQPTQLLGVPVSGPWYLRSFDFAKKAGTKMKACVERQHS